MKFATQISPLLNFLSCISIFGVASLMSMEKNSDDPFYSQLKCKSDEHSIKLASQNKSGTSQRCFLMQSIQ